MAYLARNLRLKVEEPHDSGTYKFIGGMQSLSISTSTVNETISNIIGQTYNEMITDTGPKSYSISGSGIFKNSVGERIMASARMTGEVRRFKITFGNGDQLNGLFVVTTFDRSGDSAGAETYSTSLESSGLVESISANAWENLTFHFDTETTDWESLV